MLPARAHNQRDSLNNFNNKKNIICLSNIYDCYFNEFEKKGQKGSLSSLEILKRIFKK